MSDAMDKAYQLLASAREGEQLIAGEQQQDLQQIEQREGELQEQLRASEEAGEPPDPAVEQELEDLGKAYLTIRDQMEDDDDAQGEHEDAAGRADERGGDGDPAEDQR